MVRWLTDFRVLGRWGEIDSTFVNVTSDPNFFLSQPAIWDYGMGAGEPQLPIIAGKTARITVHEPVDHGDGMLSPIHKACLDILQRLCQIRQAQNEASASEEPKTLDAFCDALRQRRWRNFIEPDKSTSEDYYYAKSGGIEWLHNYYGARQFWTDEWDTEPGWELLCGDPSRLTIPGLTPYLLSELPKLPSTSTAQTVSKDQVADRLGWLFPEEIDAIIGNDTGVATGSKAWKH
ncbi:hypothetical protein HO173_009506 [Letharia columbiana]|uniref:Uncharacterized protein n=1 Tax=Letharia columbiana TaxID=112416 RepID=A0A8H6L1X0_9LECA|nr:uncharacterized protein HO173_009506 [Letharia columbiana]KAF6232401.1 hypothetical protein HO173_009506 [Letharia columbiana]